jgi:hypothetical protein
MSRETMFDFLKGKIEIQLTKYSFSPGEYVEGTVVLKMKKQVHARGVKVGITATRTEHRMGAHGRRSYSSTLYEFEQHLDGEKDYGPTTDPVSYPFKLGIPAREAQPMPDGALGTLVKAAQILSSGSSRVTWVVKAHLDIPAGFDISKHVQINVM